MNKHFNVKNMANETANLPATKLYNSWSNVVRMLDNVNFNDWEAEAILRSKHPIMATCGMTKLASATVLETYLKDVGITHRSKKVNELVMKAFGKGYNLELNDEGVPCRRGTMPGNYHPNKTILVPVGTPLCCDPTSETYWSM